MAGGGIGRAAGGSKVLLTALLCGFCALTGQAFSLYKDVFSVGNIDETYSSSSLFNSTLFGPPPASGADQFVRWPSSHLTITYALDPNFKNMFPASDLPGISSQIALAFQSWQNASSPIYIGFLGYDGEAASPQLPTTMNGAPPPNSPTDFGDIRTIALHEIGHALGLAHPGPYSDPFSPFPNDPTTGAYQNLDLNYASPTSPAGVPAAGASYFFDGLYDTPVMNDFLYKGEYRRILTWDELNAYYFAYGSATVTFTPIPYVASTSASHPNGSTADILITAANLPNNPVGESSSFADTIVYGSYNNGSPGNITSAKITFNHSSPIKIGYVPLGVNWDFTVNSFNVHSVKVFTMGTDNTKPEAYYDNNSAGGTYVFNAGGPPTGVSQANDGAGDKNEIIWTWALPGTAAQDITAGKPFHPGLVLDVNNWLAYNAFAYPSAPNQNLQQLTPMTAVEDYFDSNPDFQASAGRPVSGPETEANALSYVPTSISNAAPALGISLLASGAPQSVVSQLQWANVTGLGLVLSNLNQTGLQQLAAAGMVNTVTNFGVYTLGPYQRFALVLQGTTNDLPPDVLTNGNYFIMNRPDLVTQELFLAWQTTNSGSVCENFALLGQPSLGSLPVLTINPCPSGGVQTNVVAWGSPATGYVLQQNPDLLSTNWVNVPTSPTVAINPSLGGYQNQVMVPSQPSQAMFYRLANF